MPPGLMTSFNVSVGPVYSFFYQLNWLLLLITQKYLKIPQTSFFPKHGPGSDSCWPSSQPSLGSSSAPVALLFGGLLKGKDSGSTGKSTGSWNDFCFFFLPWSWSASPDASGCINWFIACLSWKTLQILEYAKNTSSLQPFGGLSGLFPPSWLRHLSRTIAGDAPCGLAQAYRELVLNWNDIISWGGKENCNIVGARSD